MARAYKVKKKQPNENNIASSAAMTAPHELKLLFTVVNREKADFYADMIQNYDVNMQLILAANGTADTKIKGLLGFNNSEKSVIISVVRDDKCKSVLSELDQKFKTVKGGKGIAYIVPMSSMIGVAIYQFLSNAKDGGLI